MQIDESESLKILNLCTTLKGTNYKSQFVFKLKCTLQCFRLSQELFWVIPVRTRIEMLHSIKCGTSRGKQISKSPENKEYTLTQTLNKIRTSHQLLVSSITQIYQSTSFLQVR